MKITVLIAVLISALNVSHSYGASCTISTTGINFGTYNPLNATPLDSDGTVSITCRRRRGSNSTSGYVDLYPGVGAGGSCTTPREMTNGPSNLQYDIYLNASRTTKWCWNGSSGTGWQSFNFPDLSPPVTQTYTAYGRVFGSQTSATPGTYTQTIWAAVEYN